MSARRRAGHSALGLIGAGKFGSMYLAQVPKTPGVHLVGIADLAPTNARTNLQRVGWSESVCGDVARGSAHVGRDPCE